MNCTLQGLSFTNEVNEWATQTAEHSGVKRYTFQCIKNIACACRDAKCVSVCLWAEIKWILTVWNFHRSCTFGWGDCPSGADHQGPGLAKALFLGSHLFLTYEMPSASNLFEILLTLWHTQNFEPKMENSIDKFMQTLIHVRYHWFDTDIGSFYCLKCSGLLLIHSRLYFVWMMHNGAQIVLMVLICKASWTS